MGDGEHANSERASRLGVRGTGEGGDDAVAAGRRMEREGGEKAGIGQQTTARRMEGVGKWREGASDEQKSGQVSK